MFFFLKKKKVNKNKNLGQYEIGLQGIKFRKNFINYELEWISWKNAKYVSDKVS